MYHIINTVTGVIPPAVHILGQEVGNNFFGEDSALSALILADEMRGGEHRIVSDSDIAEAVRKWRGSFCDNE